ncbi:MAG: site-2 protease family protein [Clostridia bacterium]|nr:site-2 protease family protein [Clostridia bacterium]
MILIKAVLDFLNTIWPFLLAILAFLIMIVIHEFGHFIAARLTGVRVNEFSVGFGPALFKKQGRETLYAVRAVPFGGYCAMEGEDSKSDDSAAFCNKKPWKRFLIIIMGALFNLIFGFILIMITLAPVKVYTTTTIDGFHENAVSVQSGLQEGDTILEVDGRRIYTTYDLSYNFTGIKGNSVDMIVSRDGEEVVLKDVVFQTKESDGVNYIAVDFYVRGENRSFVSYFSQSFKTAFSYARVVLFSLVDLITGKFGISAVSGPVGVTVAISEVARIGIMELLPLIALISINLGLFNLLPIPALDGSRAIFILIEMISGKPVPQKYEAFIHAAGFILLIALMLLVTAKDIFSLF